MLSFRTLRRLALFSLPVAAIMAAVLAWSFGQPAPQVSADSDCQSFTNTPYKVCGRFLDYYRTHGGLTQQGLPISDVFEEKNPPSPAGDGQTHRVQYFERARFEEHLENQPPYDILLGLIGTEQFKAKYAGPTPKPVGTPVPTLPSQPTSGPECLGNPAIITGTVAQACVSNLKPTKNSNVTLYARLVSGGNGVAGTLMDATWHFQSRDQFCSGTPGTDGLVRCTLNILDAPANVPVTVDVRFIYNKEIFTVTTSFTPQ